jgi:enoyl-[acyl-carrier-protein] reductase (NADH)
MLRLLGIPAGWMRDQLDIANAQIYLKSDGSDNVTGTSTVVDGGCGVH